MTYGQLEALLNKIDKYEKVLDEIREYIKENVYKHYDSYNDIEYDEIEEPDKLLQILDKVKEL